MNFFRSALLVVVKQIVELLVVNFNKSHSCLQISPSNFALRQVCLNGSQPVKLVHGPEKDALFLIISKHGEGLARATLAVSKERQVDAL